MNAEPDAGAAFSPAEIARRVETAGVAKARTDALTLTVLAVLAGAFISIGALLSAAVRGNLELAGQPTAVPSGIAFSLGLFLVVVAGAELFTGNNLLAMAFASRRIGAAEVLRNWGIVYAGNVAGCVLTAALAGAAGLGEAVPGAIARGLAAEKLREPLVSVLAQGILCNALVCLAVWLSMGARGVADKCVAVAFPVTAFVVLGLEHSIANWFWFSFAFVTGTDGAGPGGPTALASPVAAADAAGNLVASTAGNVLGGTVLVALLYWIAYLRPARR